MIQASTALKYGQLKAAIDEKCTNLFNRKGLIFHHDNARLHVSLMTKQKFFPFG